MNALSTKEICALTAIIVGGEPKRAADKEGAIKRFNNALKAAIGEPSAARAMETLAKVENVQQAESTLRLELNGAAEEEEDGEPVDIRAKGEAELAAKKAAEEAARKAIDEAPEKAPTPAPAPAPAPKAAPAPKGERKLRGMRFVFPVGDDIKKVRPGTNRATLIDMLSRPEGATFEECLAATWGTNKEMDAETQRKTCYEGLRLLHYYVGYGMTQDEQGRIRLKVK